MATAREMSALQDHAYGAYEGRFVALPGKWVTATHDIDGHVQFNLSRLTDSTSGYSAMVYRNTETGEIAIVHNGTNGAGDIPADASILLRQLPVRQLATAEFLVEEVRRAFGPSTTIWQTGHSLGGFIAEANVARRISSGEKNWYAVSIGAPGAAGFLAEIGADPSKDYSLWITAICDPNDPIAGYFPHVGRAVALNSSTPFWLVASMIPFPLILPYAALNIVRHHGLGQYRAQLEQRGDNPASSLELRPPQLTEEQLARFEDSLGLAGTLQIREITPDAPEELPYEPNDRSYLLLLPKDGEVATWVSMEAAPEDSGTVGVMTSDGEPVLALAPGSLAEVHQGPAGIEFSLNTPGAAESYSICVSDGGAAAIQVNGDHVATLEPGTELVSWTAAADGASWKAEGFDGNGDLLRIRWLDDGTSAEAPIGTLVIDRVIGGTPMTQTIEVSTDGAPVTDVRRLDFFTTLTDFLGASTQTVVDAFGETAGIDALASLAAFRDIEAALREETSVSEWLAENMGGGASVEWSSTPPDPDPTLPGTAGDDVEAPPAGWDVGSEYDVDPPSSPSSPDPYYIDPYYFSPSYVYDPYYDPFDYYPDPVALPTYDPYDYLYDYEPPSYDTGFDDYFDSLTTFSYEAPSVFDSYDFGSTYDYSDYYSYDYGSSYSSYDYSTSYSYDSSYYTPTYSYTPSYSYSYSYSFSYFDPIVLDLDGDGLELIGIWDSDVFFDMDLDGYAERTGWVVADDGLVVLDRNGDGAISDSSEMFSEHFSPSAASGLAALAEMDSNGDGVLDGLDPGFDSVRVWRDLDQNGASGPAELATLASLDITSLSLTGVAGHDLLDGNAILQQTSFTRPNGGGLAADVGLLVSRDGFRREALLGTGGAMEKIISDSGKAYGVVRDAAAHVVDLGASHLLGVVGGAGADTFTTSGTNAILAGGGDGADTISGGPGDDVLTGGAGSDALAGGGGSDTLAGGPGADTLSGGEGVDTVSYQASAAAVAVSLASGVVSGGDAADDVLTAIEDVIGSGFDDVLDGDATANVLEGGRGADELRGGGGNDAYRFNRGDGVDIVHDYEAVSVPYTEQVPYEYEETYTYYELVWYGGGEGADWVQEARTGVRTASGLHSETRYRPEPVDGGADTLAFGAGIALRDLEARIIGSDLVVGVKPPGGGSFQTAADHITLRSWVDAKHRVETFTFADGTTLDVAGIASTLGTDEHDAITWTETAVTVTAGTGDDSVATGASADKLAGEDGNDTLHGGAGDDTLVGGAGSDVFDGGPGNDLLYVDADDVQANLSGGDGVDGIIVTDARGVTIDLGAARVEVGFGGDGDDTMFTTARARITVEGRGGDDVLKGNARPDKLDGGAGDDTLIGFAGGDSLVGGDGFDTVSYETSQTPVRISLGEGTAAGGDADADALTTIESLVGTPYADTLTGDAVANSLVGGAGDDTLVGGGGADTLDGGAGADVVSYAASEAGVVASMDGAVGVGGDAAGDILRNVETLTGSSSDDVLYGNEADNALNGGVGDDRLCGEAGADQLDGGAGIDTAAYETSSAAVVISLSAGTATGGDATGDRLVDVENLTGSAHDDALAGNATANRLEGRAGADTLRAGGGDDTYAVNRGDGVDVVHDEAHDEVVTTVTTYYGGGEDGYWVTETTVTTHAIDGGSDTLAFGAGVTPGDVWMKASGADLIVGIAAHRSEPASFDALADRVILKDWFAANTRVERVQFADGQAADIAAHAQTFGGTPVSVAAVTGLLAGSLPVAGADAATVAEDTGVALAATHLLANDHDSDGMPLRIESVGDAAHGAVTLTSDGVVHYAPEPDFAGADRFSYSVRNPEGATATGTVDVTVTPVNDPPLAAPDAVTAPDELTIAIPAATLLANDTDVEDDRLRVTAVGGATHGAVTLESNGAVTYTPVADFTGVDSFAYTISDGRGGTATSSVTVTVDTHDTISFRAASSAVSVNLATGSVTGAAEGTSLAGKQHVVGSSYDDTVSGDAGANRLRGGPGADTLAGGAGNDVYLVDSGGGLDLVHDDHRYAATSTREEAYTCEVWVEWSGGEAGSIGYWETRSGIRHVTETVETQDDAGDDSLGFADGISAVDVWVKRDGDDLVVAIVSGGSATASGFDALADRMRLKDWANVDNRVETLRFADGTSMDIAVLAPHLGPEPINLAAGVDQDDTLSGTAGDDLFFFRRGDGADVIAASNSTTATDRVVFGGAIDPDQLWFARRNDDLEVAVVGGGGRLAVRDWYVNAASRVDEFRVADGRVLVESHVQQLVNAMAAFDPPAGTDVRLGRDVRDEIEPMLAASWQRPTTTGTAP